MKTTSTRPGFTLIELLVVVAIIGALIGITAFAVFQWIPTRYRQNTEDTLSKVQSALDAQWKRAIDDARDEIKAGKANDPQLLVLAGNDPNRAAVIYIKMKLKQQFPISFAEAANPNVGTYLNGVNVDPSYTKHLTGRVTANTNANTESAACLLMALTARDRRSGGISGDDLGNLSKADTDNDGVPEIVDGYGLPVKFYRWPLNHPATFPGTSGRMAIAFPVSPVTTATAPQDPQDPFGTLQAAGWRVMNGNTAGRNCGTEFKDVCHPLTYDPTTLDPVTTSPISGTTLNTYHVPVIASSGRDKLLGLDAWMKILPTPGTGDSNGDLISDEEDNIYSFSRR